MATLNKAKILCENESAKLADVNTPQEKGHVRDGFIKKTEESYHTWYKSWKMHINFILL